MTPTGPPLAPDSLSPASPRSVGLTTGDAEPPSQIEPDREEANRYLALLDPQAKKWTFLTFDDVELPDGMGGWKKRKDGLTREFHGTLNDHWEALIELNRRGAGIYVTVNETDFQGRGANNIRRIRAVWRDDDNGGARNNTVGNQPAPITASLIVQTSPTKYQDYWLHSPRKSVQRAPPLTQKRSLLLKIFSPNG